MREQTASDYNFPETRTEDVDSRGLFAGESTSPSGESSVSSHMGVVIFGRELIVSSKGSLVKARVQRNETKKTTSNQPKATSTKGPTLFLLRLSKRGSIL